jgi:hypothetical protein
MRCVQIEATKYREGIVTHHERILKSRMLMSIQCHVRWFETFHSVRHNNYIQHPNLTCIGVGS